MANAADTTASFAIDLQSNAGPVAAGAGAALEDLKSKIQGDIGALREMQKAMRSLQSGSVVNIDAARKLKDQIAAQKATISANQAAFINAGGAFKAVGKEAEHTGGVIARFVDRLSGMQGTLGKIGKVAGASTKEMTAFRLATIGATVASFALVAATGLAIEKTARFAIGQADARRSELLHLEGLNKLRMGYMMLIPGFARANDSAKFLQDQIDAVSDSSALGREQVAAYTEKLYKMGLRSGNLQAALEAVTTTAAVKGEAAGDAIGYWAASLQMTGGSVKKLADHVKAELGGIAAEQLLSLDVQSRKLKERIDRLFSGIKLEGFLEGLNKITSLFSQTTAEGRALKQLVEVIFQPLIDQASGGAIIVKRFFQGMILGFQQIVIWSLQARIWWKKTFGSHDILAGIDATTAAVWLGVGAVGALAGLLGLAAVNLLILISPILALGAAIYGIWAAIDQGKKLIADAGGWKAAGKAIVMAIGQGIGDGTLFVLNAIINVGKKAWQAFKDSIQMHSPPRLFVKGGFAIGQAVGIGVRESRPQVARDMRAVFEPPEPRFAAEMARQSGNTYATERINVEAPREREAPQTSTVHVGDIHIHDAKTDDPKALAARVRSELAIALQGIGVAKGAKAA